MYHIKTVKRLETLKKSEYWRNLLEKDKVIINGKTYNGWPYFKSLLEEKMKDLYKKDEMTFLHGDLCLGNILFDPNSRIFKFIDPRGSFGEVSVYGDNKYDIAKLRHSFSGQYDFIVSDLFSVEEDEDAFSFTIFSDSEHVDIGKYFDQTLKKNGYDLKKIRFIEALLFLSMIPLHSDGSDRQKAMFLTGIQLLNKTKQ